MPPKRRMPLGNALNFRNREKIRNRLVEFALGHFGVFKNQATHHLISYLILKNPKMAQREFYKAISDFLSISEVKRVPHRHTTFRGHRGKTLAISPL